MARRNIRVAEEGYPADGSQPYGRSGSVLLLNPTDKRVQRGTSLTAGELRAPPVVRAWPEELPPLTPPDPDLTPTITEVEYDLATLVVYGTNFTAASRVQVKKGTASFANQSTTFRSATELYVASYPQTVGTSYQVRVLDPETGVSNVVSFVP